MDVLAGMSFMKSNYIDIRPFKYQVTIGGLLNSLIRFTGKSARELWTQPSRYTNKQIQVSDLHATCNRQSRHFGKPTLYIAPYQSGNASNFNISKLETLY